MTRPDLTGRRFGKWYVETEDPVRHPFSRSVYWLVVCDCGTEGSVRTTELLSGHSTKCRACAHEAMRKKKSP